ncbi:MAG TPA: hypothetical protein VGU25_14125 [Acidobacteriaceae bacterium]|nr:hypothetical protein [Acidobacteriaceae bacterium]
MSDISNLDFDSMTPAEFEQYLPELFASGEGGKLSEDPRLETFLSANPDCAALVRDLETIADTAKNLLVSEQEPSDSVWSNIASKLQQQEGDGDEPVDLSE